MKLSDIPAVKLPEDTELHRVALISNITLEPWFSPCLAAAFAQHKYRIQVRHIDYTAYHDESLASIDSIVVILSFEELYPDDGNSTQIYADCSAQCRELYHYIKASTDSPVIWLGFEDHASPASYVFGHTAFNDYLPERLNDVLRSMLLSGDSYLDIPRMIAEVGTRTAYDTKSRYRWNAPYSGELISLICHDIHKLWLAEHSISPKCLILDCDNVLWQGTLADDGISGVSIDEIGAGRFYRDFQRFVLKLYRYGVILALCTKNDRSVVLDMLQHHSGMLLHEEHFACIRANWDNKPDNIRAIAELLGIGLDSMVFVDDSPYEVGMVNESLPQVRTILFRRDTVFADFACFSLPIHRDDEQIALRNTTYRTNVMRNELKSLSTDNEAYLRALDTKTDIHEASEYELMRIAELSQRANRCTNGARFTAPALKDALHNGMKLYAVTAADRFSDLGMVGSIGIQNQTLVLFTLSCRALGRNIESMMLTFSRDAGTLKYEFYDTGKNEALQNSMDAYFTLNA